MGELHLRAHLRLLGQRRRRAQRIGARDALRLTALGFIGYYFASLLDFIGLQYVSASLERLVLFLYPTIVVALSAVQSVDGTSRSTAKPMPIVTQSRM